MGEATAGASEVRKPSRTSKSATEEAEGAEANKMNGWLKLFSTTYGPYAFGVISLLIVWFAIVRPELSDKQMDLKAHQEIMSQQKDQCNSLERTSSNLKETSTIQERIVDRLERMLDK